MRFVIPASLLGLLRARGRAEPFIEGHESFTIYPGRGPSCHLTADGRVFIDAEDWDGTPIREARDEEALAALVVGAKSTRIRELLDLLPSPPPDARPCATCHGSRFSVHGILCFTCWGLGWTVPFPPDLLALHASVQQHLRALGPDVEATADPRGVIVCRAGKRFAGTRLRWFSKCVLLAIRTDPSTESLEEGYTHEVSGNAWRLVPWDDRTRDLELTLRSPEDFERAKPLLRQAYEGR
jgi:hypothetical protein